MHQHKAIFKQNVFLSFFEHSKNPKIDRITKFSLNQKKNKHKKLINR
jgi:hypothetical protein